MVAKVFSSKGGGGGGAIDYLLDKDRLRLKQAEVLKGNEELTRKLIDIIDNKQKLMVGCLSFSEENIDEDLKFKLMDEFELMLFAGLDPAQYNILWVEHTDKGRLELNFAIPKLELSTKKALQPYYHKSDLPRLEMWQDMTNLKYGFSNPKDPENRRSVNTTKVEIGRTKDYASLNRALQKGVREGKVTSRVQMINVLKKNDIEVTRIDDNYISLKLPNSKKARRFKGDIYTSRFTSLESLNVIKEEQEEEIEEFKNLDVDSEIEKLSTRLEKYVEDKATKNKKKYPYTPEAEEELEDIEMHYTGGQDDSIGEEIIGRVGAERSMRQEVCTEITDSYTESLKGFRTTRRDVEDEFSENADNLATKDDGSTGELRELFERVVSKIGELAGKIVEKTIKPFRAIRDKVNEEDISEDVEELEVGNNELIDDFEDKALDEEEKMLEMDSEEAGVKDEEDLTDEDDEGIEEKNTSSRRNKRR